VLAKHLQRRGIGPVRRTSGSEEGLAVYSDPSNLLAARSLEWKAACYRQINIEQPKENATPERMMNRLDS
jgi:hypothetical protein